MAKYVCVNECFWRGQVWAPGTPYEGDAVPPKHFADVTAPVKTKVPKGVDLGKKMTLSQAHAELGGNTATGKIEPKTISEASDLFS